MLNSEFNQIVGRNVIDLKCGESLVLEYSCFTTLKDKTKIENIIDAYLKDGYCKNLKYSYNTISGFDLLKLNIRMVFKKEKSTNLSVIECLVGEFSHLNTLISKYVNKKYPQSLGIKGCFGIQFYDTTKDYIYNYIILQDYFKDSLNANKFYKGDINYDYSICIKEKNLIYRIYCGNVNTIGVRKALYEQTNAILNLNDSIIERV